MDATGKDQLDVGLLANHIAGLVPGLQREEKTIDRCKDGFWVLVSTSSDYSCEGLKNHYMPAFFTEQVGEDTFEALFEAEQEADAKSIAEAAEQLDILRKSKSPASGNTDTDVQLQTEINHYESWKTSTENLYKLRKLCADHGICFCPVPGDGNCLIWSLRMLHMGLDHEAEASEGQSRREQRLLRNMLSNRWLAVKDDPTWQTVFNCLAPEQARQEGAGTVLKKELSAKVKMEQKPSSEKDKLTPPKVDPPENARKIQRIGDAKPVSGFVRSQTQSELALKLPGSTNKVVPLESPVPDINDLFDKVQSRVPLPANPAEDDPEDSLDLSEGDDPNRRRKRKVHSRTCQKRLKSQRELQMDAINTFLASKNITYHDFRLTHRRACPLRRTESCSDGGFVEFKIRVMKKQEHNCHVCLQIYVRAGLTHDIVDEIVDGTMACEEENPDKASTDMVEEGKKKRRKVCEEKLDIVEKILTVC